MDPKPKQSTRFGAYGAYADPKVVAAQILIQTHARKAMRTLGTKMALGPIRVEYHFNIYKGKASKKTHATQRPDVDNLTKLIGDALNGIAWKDDSQIISLHATKTFAEDEPSVTVRAYLV